MLELRNVDEKFEDYKELSEKALSVISKKLNLQDNNIKVDLKELNNNFELVSESLPLNKMGLWSYAVKNIYIEIMVWIKGDKVCFAPMFRYEHYDGGRNGCDINLSKTGYRSMLVYDKELDVVEIK